MCMLFDQFIDVCVRPPLRLPGTAVEDEEILARLAKVREDIERSKAAVEQRKQSIAGGHARWSWLRNNSVGGRLYALLLYI